MSQALSLLEESLRCPVCEGPLAVQRKLGGRPARLHCVVGHRFDAAKQGHINLLTGRGSRFLEDTPAMVASRERWLDGGGYAPLGGSLAALALQHSAAAHPVVVDTGSGTGWYTRQVLDALANAGRPAAALDMDLSRAGAQRAARDERVLSVVWDTWQQWPLAGSSADLILDVFAPRNEPEFARVLRRGGVLLVAVPLAGHLAELANDAGMLGIDEHKEERLAATFAERWDELEGADVCFTRSLGPADAADLAHMGPAGHHRSREEMLEQLAHTPLRSVSVRVRVHAYRLR